MRHRILNIGALAMLIAIAAAGEDRKPDYSTDGHAWRIGEEIALMALEMIDPESFDDFDPVRGYAWAHRDSKDPKDRGLISFRRASHHARALGVPLPTVPADPLDPEASPKWARDYLEQISVKWIVALRTRHGERAAAVALLSLRLNLACYVDLMSAEDPAKARKGILDVAAPSLPQTGLPAGLLDKLKRVVGDSDAFPDTMQKVNARAEAVLQKPRVDVTRYTERPTPQSIWRFGKLVGANLYLRTPADAPGWKTTQKTASRLPVIVLPPPQAAESQKRDVEAVIAWADEMVHTNALRIGALYGDRYEALYRLATFKLQRLDAIREWTPALIARDLTWFATQAAIPKEVWTERAAAIRNSKDAFSAGLLIDAAQEAIWKSLGPEKKPVREASASKTAPEVTAGVRLYKQGDRKGAIEQWSKAAVRGDTLAMRWMGRAYRELEDTSNAARWYARAADAGETRAYWPLAQLYLKHLKDYGEARHWALKAAEVGEPEAMYALGLIYALGRGVKEDPEQARRWYLKAAEKDHARAMIELGNAAGGAELVQWYTRAAKTGDVEALRRFGHLYSRGDRVPRDYAKAVHWYEKCAAAAENAKVEIDLGVLYGCGGHNLAADPVVAERWLQKARESKDEVYARRGATRLGFLHFDRADGKRDVERALALFREIQAQAETVEARATGAAFMQWVCLRELGRHDEAQKLIAGFRPDEWSPAGVVMRYMRGDIRDPEFEKRTRPSEAHPDKDKLAAYYFAYYQLSRGDRSSAAKHFRMAAAIDRLYAERVSAAASLERLNMK